MSTDPYSSSASHESPVSASTDSLISQGVLRQLAGTKPWVRLMSVLMFIGAGFLLLFALIFGLAGQAIFKNNQAGAFPVWGNNGIVIFYFVIAFIYIYPALKLWKYASGIGALLISSSMTDLENALSQQRSFWKFLGIMMIAIFILYLAILIAVIVVGGFAAMKVKGA